MLSALPVLLASLAAVPAAASAQSDPTLVLQVLLDRAAHSPGVIDGKKGSNTRRAVAAFERTSGLPVDGKVDPEVLAALKSAHGGEVFEEYTIKQADIDRLVDVPDGMEAQSKLDHLGFETAREALAEKFHMSQGLLQRLSPDADFSAVGSVIRVVRPSADALAGKVARIEIDKAASELRAFGADDKLIASYPATVGSNKFPSPSGNMEVRTIAPEPKYYFEPDGRSWGPDERLTIAAGPNNPVGSTWIDLTKEGYGIHGTPDPRLIGKTGSHGCVRLTNWDARELSQAVSAGTKVVFVG